jgi:hypothetical protein
MDILPSLVASGYKIILEKSFSASEVNAIDQLSIRITDNMEANYKTSPHPEQWPKSNPFGFGRWFFYQASLGLKKARSFQESVQPVPSFQKEKLPLQRVVQILKRHRDLMFKGDQDKPVSMIITTLAARAYGQEPYIIEALLNVIQKMPSLIERRYSPKWGREIAWIGNPVNQEENYADKWPDHPQREAKFMKWMNQVSIDVQNAIAQIGIPKIQESLEKPFGKDAIRKAFTRYGEIQQRLRVSGALKMASGSGILSESGQISVKAHTFFGGNE